MIVICPFQRGITRKLQLLSSVIISMRPQEGKFQELLFIEGIMTEGFCKNCCLSATHFYEQDV